MDYEIHRRRGETRLKAELAKMGALPNGDRQLSEYAPGEILEMRANLRRIANTAIDRLGGRQPSEDDDALLDVISQQTNKLNAHIDVVHGAGGGSVMGGTSTGRGRSVGEQIAAGFEAHRDLFKSTGAVSFDIKNAATDPVTTGEVGTTASLGPVAPPFLIGAQYGVMRRTVPAATNFTYPRFVTVEGAAAVQTEGAAKAQIHPDFDLITQASMQIAVWTEVTQQALQDQAELAQAANVLLRGELGKKTDGVLMDGSGGAWAGLEALATAYTSLVYTGLADAASEAVATMQTAGFNPNVAIMSPADWLAVTVAKASGGEYLSGDYLAPLPAMMRGLRVVLSPSAPAGKVLVIDSAHVELLDFGSITIRMAMKTDDFVKNKITLLAEQRMVPVLRATGAMRMITPKAA